MTSEGLRTGVVDDAWVGCVLCRIKGCTFLAFHLPPLPRRLMADQQQAPVDVASDQMQSYSAALASMVNEHLTGR